MKTYIQVIDKKGRVTFLFYNDSQDNYNGSYLVFGKTPLDFEVLITDKKGKEKFFQFDSNSIGTILSNCISSNTTEFVRKVCLFPNKDLCEFIEEKVIYFDREDLDERAIFDIEKNLYVLDNNNFFFRLREKPNGKWVLSLVFSYNKEIESYPTKWYRFSK
jgi:hypothetical protein